MKYVAMVKVQFIFITDLVVTKYNFVECHSWVFLPGHACHTNLTVFKKKELPAEELQQAQNYIYHPHFVVYLY